MIRKIGFVVALVLMLSSGCAQEKDDLDSIRKAAEQGSARAQSNLGFMYYEGTGVTQDYILAHKWANLAAEKLSGKEREPAVKLRNRIAEQMTREEIAEAQKLASEWKPKVHGEDPNPFNFIPWPPTMQGEQAGE